MLLIHLAVEKKSVRMVSQVRPSGTRFRGKSSASGLDDDVILLARDLDGLGDERARDQFRTGEVGAVRDRTG